MLGIGSERRGGKTYTLVQRLIKDEYCFLVVGTYQEKRRIINEYQLKENQAFRVITFNDIEQKNRLRGYGRDLKLMIDNVDDFLWNLFNFKIDAVSFTGNAINPLTVEMAKQYIDFKTDTENKRNKFDIPKTMKTRLLKL